MLRYFILWSVLLLNSVPIVHAASPAKPNLDLKVQGLNIDVEWSVPGATGYRLFYVSQATPDKTEVVDMGSVTSISGRMEAGTAMSVMVQAYNEDGDSPLSDAKSFVITDPAATADPGAFQPEAQPLNFQAVFLDTPVAFVPTAEDTTKQRRSLRDRSAKSGTEFSDGRIGMTVHIAPGLVYRNELELALCLQIDEVCEPLLIYSNDKKSATDTTNIPSEGQTSAGRYAETIVISDLPTDVEKSVYLEILMPPELSDKLRGRAESKYTVYASDVKSQNPTAKHIAVAEVPVVDLGGEDERTRSVRASTSWVGCSTSAAGGLLCKTRSFAKDFSNSTFGVGFSITPGLWLFSTKNSQSQTSRGISIGADADVTAKVFGNSIDNLATVRGALIKSSGRKVTRKLTLNVLGAEVYARNEYRNKTAGSTAVAWNACKADDTNCSYEPPSSDSEGSGGPEGQETADKDDKMLDFSKVVEKEYSKIFVVYVVPVKVAAGVSGTVGVGAGATINLVTKKANYAPAGGSSVDDYVPSTVWNTQPYNRDAACLYTYELWDNDKFGQIINCIEIPSGYGSVQIKKSTFFGNNTGGPCGRPTFNQPGIKSTSLSLVLQGSWKAELFLSGQKQTFMRGTQREWNELQGTADYSMPTQGEIKGGVYRHEPQPCEDFDTVRLTKMANTSEIGLEFDASGGPYAKLGAFASGSVTIFIVEAGIRANLTLLDNSLNLDVTALLSKNPSFSGRVYNTLKGPYGNLELYATYYVPKFSLPPWSKRTATLNIVSWSTFEKEFNIYEWSVGGSEQASEPSLASGVSDGQFIPEFVNTEPPEDAKRWVCFYKGAYFDGDRKCTKMPETCNDNNGRACKEIGFNLDVIADSWDNAVRSIKVFGPLRLAVFREKDFGRGDSAYYYASNGQVEKIGGAFYLKGSTFILDSVASSVRMTTIDTQTSYTPGSFDSYFYQDADRQGIYFSESTNSELKVSAMKANSGQDARWWDNEVSSVATVGVGVTCIYDDSNYGGYESCYAGRGFLSYLNPQRMNNVASSYSLYAGISYPLILIANSSGTIEDAGTSSLPNGSIIASGPRSGYCTTSSCTRLENDTADIAYVTGPATVFIYQNDDQQGYASVFYLDQGEWDATFLINFTDTMTSMAVRSYKMGDWSWAEMKRDKLLRSDW